MTDYLTFHDAYEHLRDIMDLNGQDVARVRRVLKRSVMEAYRKLPAMADWKYFEGVTQITTESPQSTGTVAYTHSTRQVTLTGATWPSTAQYGSVLIGDIRYPIERRISDTVVTLDPSLNPGADVAALTSYKYQRYRYLLPVDVTDVNEIVDAAQYYKLRRAPTKEVFWRTEIVSSDGYPTEWAMFPSVEEPGRWDLWLGSASETSRKLRILYTKRWTTLNDFLTNTGTVTVADDVATFDTAILTSNHVGSVLRVSNNTTAPTGLVGAHEDSDDGNTDNPPAYERIITAITSSTVATLSTPGTAAADVAFTLSSFIDCNYGMRDYFLRLCEEAYIRKTMNASEESAMYMRQALANSDMAFRQARISDSKDFETATPGLGWNEGVTITGND